MKNSKRLEGKIAVITGGNSGIGLISAKVFVNEIKKPLPEFRSKTYS